MQDDTTALHRAVVDADRAACPYAELFRGETPRETIHFLTIHFRAQAERLLQPEDFRPKNRRGKQNHQAEP